MQLKGEQAVPMVEEYTQEDLNELIHAAETAGIFIDERANMPKGPGAWPRVKSSDRVGMVIHQNGSANFKRFKDTAAYHVSKDNHISPGRGMPTTVYDVMIPDDDKPARVTAEFLDRKYSQAAANPGDENRHLLAVLVMGGYRGPGYKGYAEAPSAHQMHQLEVVTHWMQHTFGFGNEGLFGHFHFGKASCPGYWGMAWLEAKRSTVVGLESIKDWQNALLKWNPKALPKYRADGDWGGESKYWLSEFQKAINIKRTAFQDEITELFLMRAVGWTQDMHISD
jgi:hypothetical protein